MLEHYVPGRWVTPHDDGQPLLDAVTGVEVARLSPRPVPARVLDQEDTIVATYELLTIVRAA